MGFRSCERFYMPTCQSRFVCVEIRNTFFSDCTVTILKCLPADDFKKQNSVRQLCIYVLEHNNALAAFWKIPTFKG